MTDPAFASPIAGISSRASWCRNCGDCLRRCRAAGGACHRGSRTTLRFFQDPSDAKPDLAAFSELAVAVDFTKASAMRCSRARRSTSREGRAAEHSAERGRGRGRRASRRRRPFPGADARADRRDRGRARWGRVRHVLHIGIGGSALGPDLLVDALGREADRYDVAIVSNVDGVALEEALDRFDPQRTLLIVASKTFTTTETMLNAASALAWMTAGGVEDPYGQVIALTASPDKAIEWGVDETRVLPLLRERRRPLFALVVDRLSGRAGAGLGRVRGAARRRRRDGPPFPPRRARARTRRCSRPSSTSIAPGPRLPRRAPSSPMTSGFGCCPPISSSSRWRSNGKRVTAEGTPVDRPDRADHLGRRRHGCAARGVPAAPSGHAPRAGRVRRGDRGRATCSTTAHHRQLLLNCLRAGRRADGAARDDATIRRAPIRATGPSDHAAARPARSAHAGRAHRLLRDSAPS